MKVFFSFRHLVLSAAVILSLNGLSAQAQPSCASSLLTESDSHAPPQQGPVLNDRGSYHAITFPDGLVLPGAIQHHILHGDYKMMKMNETDHQPGLDGGMHTPRALQRFLSMRPDIATLLQQDPKRSHMNPNGVLRLVLPPNAGQVHHHGDGAKAHALSAAPAPAAPAKPHEEPIIKTIFPESWTDENIIAAIDEAFRTGVPDRGNPDKLVAVIRGVRMYVVVEEKNGAKTVVSAYPAGNQAPDLQQPTAAPQQPATPQAPQELQAQPHAS